MVGLRQSGEHQMDNNSGKIKAKWWASDEQRQCWIQEENDSGRLKTRWWALNGKRQRWVLGGE